jgi:Zn-dependent membrane protease YugP/Flp pilus assembly protein TadD
MISDSLLDALLTDYGQIPFGPLLICGSLAVYAAMLYAAIRDLRSTYIREGRRFSRCRLTGREAVGRLLEHLSLGSVQIDDGAQIDHYDTRRHRVKLRTESSVSSSVAALAIAAHEVGHAEQFATGYWAARATRCLLILLVLGGGVLFIYPFATIIAGTGETNLTRLVALLAVLPVMRLPVTIALERDATRRAQRLLSETRLADETEVEGIADLLRAAFRTHLAFSVGLVLLVGACVAAMSLIESGLNMPFPTDILAVSSELDPSGQVPSFDAINVNEPYDEYPYILVGFVLSVFLVWWAFRGQARKPPARSAVDANNEGMARFLAGDPASAIVLIDEALQLDPGLASAHYNRAVVLTSQGHNDEALASIEALFAARPEELEPFLAIPDLWYLRGTLRLDRGDYLGAIDDLSRALDLDPSEPATLLCNRGLAWIRLGELERALRDTEEALALAPNDAVAYNNRGVIHRDRGNFEQAERDLRRAIEIDPQFPNPREHLAKLLKAESAAATHPAPV